MPPAPPTAVTSTEDARVVIVARLDALGWSPSDLWREVKPYGVRRSTVFEFVAGRRPKLNLPDFLTIARVCGVTLIAKGSRG